MKKTLRGRMGSCLRVAGFGLLGLVVLLLAAGYVLMAYAPAARTAPQPVELDQVRQAALAGGQPLPVRINALLVAEGAYTSTLVVAGSGFQDRRLVIPVFQIVYPDRTIVVDTAHSQAKQAEMFPGSPYSAAAYDQLQQALRRSSLILATHEHFDHLGGLASSPYLEELLPKVRLTRAQIANIGPEVGFPATALDRITPLEYSGLTQAAPGVALIAMPGHSKGSQMIYVRLQSGAEYLLVGDVVWSEQNLKQQSGRAWLVNLSMGEDRVVHSQQVRALIDLAEGTPGLHLVISHDGEQIENYIQNGLLGGSFE